MLRQGDCNEYPQHMFLWSNKQNYPFNFSMLSFFVFVFEILPFRGCTPTLEVVISSKSLQCCWYFDTKHADSQSPFYPKYQWSGFLQIWRSRDLTGNHLRLLYKKFTGNHCTVYAVQKETDSFVRYPSCLFTFITRADLDEVGLYSGNLVETR